MRIVPPVDYGEPIAYLALEEGSAVISSDGREVGKVEHVLADEDADIFDGIVVDTRLGPGSLVFVDAPLVSEIRERAVLISVPAAKVSALPKPEPNPGVLEHHGVEDAEGGLQEKLRRAWDRISGNA